MYNERVSTRSLYIHWPFCPYRCHFCPFVALAGHDQFMERYHRALVKEIGRFNQNVDSKQVLDTVFIGGGTPSTYPDDLLLDMFDKLKGKFDIHDDTEVTIEVNPGTVCERQQVLWKKLGINRVSIGVQSLNNAVLKKLNRLQSSDTVAQLLCQAEHLFDALSVDLILGLPGVSLAEWKRLLAEVVSWPIKHISVYFLTVHENTRLYFDIQRQKVGLPTDDSIVAAYHWSVTFLRGHGFRHYETSNFARSGYECRHNNACWERKPYKGFGLGACSFDGTSRFQNQKNLMNYLEAVEEGADPIEFAEALSPEQVHLEKVMLGLRRSSGILRKDLFRGRSMEQIVDLKKIIARLKMCGYVEEHAARIVLTSAALTVQNEIAVQLSG